jgi:hypothetical protein
MKYRRILIWLFWFNLLILPIFVAATVWADSPPLGSGVDWTRSAPAATVPGAPPAYPRTNLSASTETTSYIYLPFISKNHTIVAITPLWRFGAAKVRQSPLSYQSAGLANLRLGWYVDYGANGGALTSLNMDYVPTVGVKQLKIGADGKATALPCQGCAYVSPPTYSVSPALSDLPAIVGSHPGLVWVVGNEIERRDWCTGSLNCGQSEILPDLYAQAYHEIYTTIKTADQTAKVAIGSLVEWTPLRQAYLEQVWSAYSSRYGQTMQVDVWNLHIFILPEQAGGWGAGIPAGLDATQGATYCLVDRTDNRNFLLAWDQIVSFRTWMKNHDQQNKPLIITEYGVLFADWVLPGQFTPEQVRDSFMYPSFNYFLNQTNASIGYPSDGNRLVQRWIWYSLDDDTRSWNYGQYVQNYNGNLFSSGLEGVPLGMSTLGIYWQQYVAPLPADSGSHY